MRISRARKDTSHKASVTSLNRRTSSEDFGTTGRDTVQAEDLLCLVEAFQALHIADRDRLRAKINPPLGPVRSMQCCVSIEAMLRLSDAPIERKLAVLAAMHAHFNFG
jgi:hypothetical protein